MHSAPELPAQVLAAIHAGRKIDAIKLLRKERSLSLKEAKQLVDAYVLAKPDMVVQRNTGIGAGVIVFVFALAAVAYAAYRVYL